MSASSKVLEVSEHESARPKLRILSYQDLRDKGIRFSRQWIIQLIKAGKFPKPVKLGEASTGFVEEEVDDWIAGLIRQRDAASS